MSRLRNPGLSLPSSQPDFNPRKVGPNKTNNLKANHLKSKLNLAACSSRNRKNCLKNNDLLAKNPRKKENPFEVDTPQSHEELKKIKSMEEMIAKGYISEGPARGYFYYKRSDVSLWDEKEALIDKKINKAKKSIDALSKQKAELETSLQALPKSKKNKNKIKNIEEKIRNTVSTMKKIEKSLDYYSKQSTAAKAARENIMKAKSPDYSRINYREMIKKTLDKWIPKVQGTYFKKFAEYLNDPDLYRSLHVQEMMPTSYRDPKNRKIKLTNSARVHMHHLFTLYKDPLKIPAVHDPVASFGIGQTILDTHNGLIKLDISKALELPAFEECTSFDSQMRRDIINTANNMNRFFEHVVSKHKNLENLIVNATKEARGIFFAAVLGSMHNGGENCMRKPEKKLGKKLDKAATLPQATDLLLGNLHRKSVRNYGQHTRGIYSSLLP